MAESDFLAENNQCGQTLLKLVSRGNAIVAELLRLADFVPPIFKLETKEDKDKYGEILVDFGYFRSIELYDHKINSRNVSILSILPGDPDAKERNSTFYHLLEERRS